MLRSPIVRRLSRILPIALMVFLLTLSLKTIIRELKNDNWQDIWQYLQGIPHSHKLGAISLTALGYLKSS
jgi:peptidoglycan/LPS O-acetylase OafA/YrhL